MITYITTDFFPSCVMCDVETNFFQASDGFYKAPLTTGVVRGLSNTFSPEKQIIYKSKC